MSQTPDRERRYDLSTAADRWFVVCLDEDSIYTFATHRAFRTEDMARAYARSVAPSRLAQVIYSIKPLRDTEPL